MISFYIVTLMPSIITRMYCGNDSNVYNIQSNLSGHVVGECRRVPVKMGDELKQVVSSFNIVCRLRMYKSTVAAGIWS